MARPAIVALALLLGAAGCGGPDTTDAPRGSPNARPETVEVLRLDEAAERHPSDGGGSATVVSEEPSPVAAGASGRWTLVYEAGPLGVAEGGAVFFQVPAFWGWSPPQLRSPAGSGFVKIETDADGVALKPWIADAYLVGVEIAGRRLEPGERITFVYGAGPAGAVADTFAESRSTFWFTVDGDGDGVRGLVASSPSVTVVARPAERLVLSIPSLASPGETVRATVAALDRAGNAAESFTGTVSFSGLTSANLVPIGDGDRGCATVEFRVKDEGVYRLRASTPGLPEAESNPLLVVEGLHPRIFWADLQVHSSLSDGTGVPEDLYRYARDVAGLDVAAVTDHDHWGTPFLDRTPALWEEIREQARRFYEPGRFVTFLGYEWTSWLHGHRHVLYPGDEGKILSSLDPPFDTPAGLWDGLDGTGAITVAHHPAGSPVATDWSVPPDPRFETVTEIVSVHGSSEAEDSPARVAGTIPGNYVRDALDLDYRLGFVGSGDGHDGHPGLAHLAAPTGGLAAIFAERLTRESVLDAIRQRSVYATSGPRIILLVSLADRRLGIRVVGTAPIERIDIVRSGEVVESIPGEGDELDLDRRLEDLRPGEYVYVRVVQVDGALAWSSPLFVE